MLLKKPLTLFVHEGANEMRKAADKLLEEYRTNNELSSFVVGYSGDTDPIFL